MALETLEPTIILPLIHHSDRGTQYASDAYITLLFTHPEIEVSMTEKSDPYEKPSSRADKWNIENRIWYG